MASLRISSLVMTCALLMIGFTSLADCFPYDWPSYFNFNVENPYQFPSRWGQHFYNNYPNYYKRIKNGFNNMMKFGKDFIPEGNFNSFDFQQDPVVNEILNKIREEFSRLNSGANPVEKIVRTVSCGELCTMLVEIGKKNGHYYENFSKNDNSM
ncbi:uncharacterized protein LOC115214207 [Argonauta hians]